MFYKFIGGCDETLYHVFDKAVREGSVRFASAARFNDPFEFKFTTVSPSTREAFDKWHDIYFPEYTAEQRSYAWSAFDGPASDFNTRFRPRAMMLAQLYVLCLARTWKKHLMWSHYASEHRGFAICYTDELTNTFTHDDNFCGQGDVTYSDNVPELRWFEGPPSEMMGPIIGTKSIEWEYEGEYRIVLQDPENKNAISRTIDTSLIAGIILGARASETLIAKATALRSERPHFRIWQVASRSNSFELVRREVEDNVRYFGSFL
ncbi:hypothetical protein Amal_03542 [Acetobacter malorum]|uniref:DUF2971 domain-containing protein n=1 Tax=Acetobacter malorum TaxID=178901 RepID=A0A177G4K9_9PROT|nr:DUF2971 domain-containing protein [Acetobacter malorum]OAG75289.1 hypothetical protein Amal_03542 [Acetobacter malorum]